VNRTEHEEENRGGEDGSRENQTPGHHAGNSKFGS
jgi:hypothetical protein